MCSAFRHRLGGVAQQRLDCARLRVGDILKREADRVLVQAVLSAPRAPHIDHHRAILTRDAHAVHRALFPSTRGEQPEAVIGNIDHAPVIAPDGTDRETTHARSAFACRGVLALLVMLVAKVRHARSIGPNTGEF